MATARQIPVTTHGRYLVEPPAEAAPLGLLVGCHGYGESADVQMERLCSIPGARRWFLVSIQGLHRFYRGRTDQVVASWMTRQDRELAIADNSAFVAAVVGEATRDAGIDAPLVFAGFSQGVAMAFRAACASLKPVEAVLAVGGDVPPELSAQTLARLPRALVARGARDDLYPAEKWRADQARLRDAGVDVEAIQFDGVHEWHERVNREAGTLLQRLARSNPNG